MLNILSIVEISVSLSGVNIYYKDRPRHFPGLTFVLPQMKTLLGTDFYITQSEAQGNTYLINCRFLSSDGKWQIWASRNDKRIGSVAELKQGYVKVIGTESVIFEPT